MQAQLGESGKTASQQAKSCELQPRAQWLAPRGYGRPDKARGPQGSPRVEYLSPIHLQCVPDQKAESQKHHHSKQ